MLTVSSALFAGIDAGGSHCRVRLEDETGNVNLLVWRATAIAQKTAFLTARLLWVHGMLQREGDVIHVIAGQLQSLDHLLPELQSASRNFH